MPLKSLAITTGVAFAVSVAIPQDVSARQLPGQPPTVVSPVSPQPPTGRATATTDKAGQTNQPAGTTGTKQPPKGKLTIGAHKPHPPKKPKT